MAGQQPAPDGVGETMGQFAARRNRVQGSAPAFDFPILVIPDADAEWWKVIDIHFRNYGIDNLPIQMLRRNATDVGKIVVDQSGQSWQVTGMIDLGPPGRSWASRFFSRIFDIHRMEYTFSDPLNLSFDEIKKWAVDFVRSHPDGYRDDEAIAGEGGAEPRDEFEMLEELVARMQAAKSVLELTAVIEFDGRD